MYIIVIYNILCMYIQYCVLGLNFCRSCGFFGSQVACLVYVDTEIAHHLYVQCGQITYSTVFLIYNICTLSNKILFLTFRYVPIKNTVTW